MQVGCVPLFIWKCGAAAVLVQRKPLGRLKWHAAAGHCKTLQMIGIGISKIQLGLVAHKSLELKRLWQQECWDLPYDSLFEQIHLLPFKCKSQESAQKKKDNFFKIFRTLHTVLVRCLNVQFLSIRFNLMIHDISFSPFRFPNLFKYSM